VAGDFSGIHKTSTGKIVKKVSSVIAGLSPIMIRMPQREEEIAACKRRMFSRAQFPNCIGAIDCSHLKIQSPGGDQTESSFLV
jgi:hypothetical protein